MTRRAQIAETLRGLILSGQFAPGTQIIESELAARFGVSRGSVREVIWERVNQRLVVNRPYAGTYVVEIDVATMEEVYKVRGALERHCFAELWPHRDKAYAKEFAGRHEALLRAVKSKTRIEAIKAELHFHNYPYEFAGNSVLMDVWQQLSQKIQLNFVMTQSIVRSKSFPEEAQRYLDAALGDDLSAMHAEIDRHLRLGADAVRTLRPKPTKPEPVARIAGAHFDGREALQPADKGSTGEQSGFPILARRAPSAPTAGGKTRPPTVIST